MSSFVVEGGHKLSGSIAPQGAKNEALEVISAVLLTSESVTISNIPDILDIRNLISLLEGMGVRVERKGKGEYTFNASRINEFYVASAEFVEKCARLRGSVMVAGPLLARFGPTAHTTRPAVLINSPRRGACREAICCLMRHP